MGKTGGGVNGNLAKEEIFISSTGTGRPIVAFGLVSFLRLDKASEIQQMLDKTAWMY